MGAGIEPSPEEVVAASWLDHLCLRAWGATSPSWTCWQRHAAQAALMLGDRDHARALADEALDVLAGSGAELERSRGRRPRTPARRGAHALTPRETRIALMAAAGETNAATAQALFVTPKTVESHLTSTYRKLGIDGRQGLPDALGER